jgi:DNA-binding PadR family transcriptional regulator
LNLSHCHHITDEGLKDLAKYLTNLTHLKLSYSLSITDDGLMHLNSLTNLQNLDLSGCYEITDAGLKHLSENLTNLQSLNLSGNAFFRGKISNAGVKHITKLTNLTHLKLAHCDHITDEGVKDLAKLTKLQSLDLWDGGNITYSAKQSLRDRGVRVS